MASSSSMMVLPKLSLSSSRGNVEGVFQALAWACFQGVDPISGLDRLTEIKSWAQKALDNTSFLLLFDSVDFNSRTFGGFGVIGFSMDERYGVPVASKAHLCKDATKCYSGITLNAILSQMHKIQSSIMAIDAQQKGMTDRPLEHMLPTDISEQNRCKSLYDVVLCVWTRMCHVWGNKRNYGERIGDLFAPEALTCFSIDGQKTVPYIWLDVDTTNHNNYVYSIKSHTFDPLLKRTFKLWIKHPHGRGEWVSFGLNIGQQLLVSENEVNTADVSILIYSAATTAADNAGETFRVLQGGKLDNNYFMLVTERGAYKAFYKHKDDILSYYPILFHPMIENALGLTPKIARSPRKSCSMCSSSTKALSVYEFGSFCSKSCLIAYTQQKKIRNVKIEFEKTDE